LLQVSPPELRLQRAIDRANAYRAAGADSLFVPGVHDAGTIATLAREIAGPFNILAVATTPPVAELARAGVARISLGSAGTRAALSAIARSTAAVFESGHFESMLDSAFSDCDVDTPSNDVRLVGVCSESCAFVRAMTM
jgi:2-methylisocitrate lyase-like PEP mutase family enzyme